MNKPAPPVVFLDMDETLVAGNSARMYAKAMWRAGKISLFDLFKVFYFFIKYRLALIDMVAATEQIISKMKGMSEATLRSRCREIFEGEMYTQIYPEAVAVIEKARQEGSRVVILTASSNYMVEPLARHLEITEYLCTWTHAEDGILTGTYEAPVCFGEGKLFWARDYCSKHGFDLKDCAFYTDSYTDLPVLLEVGEPVVVNPDPRLALHARSEGWDVRQFKIPSE